MQLRLPFLQLPEGVLSPTAAGPHAAVQLSPEHRTEFVRVRRARRYILRVRPDGTLRVTVPRGGSRREAQAFVSESRHWIERERRRVATEHAPPAWRPGTEILLGGVPVALAVSQREDGWTVTYGRRRVAVTGVDVDLRAQVEADLRRMAEVELVPRIRALARQHGLAIGRVRIRDQRSRWGSCARTGGLALNFRLVQMPDAVRDYVMIHELMHLRQLNHSRRFWRLVAAACPGYRDAERWLRTKGRSLF